VAPDHVSFFGMPSIPPTACNGPNSKLLLVVHMVVVERAGSPSGKELPAAHETRVIKYTSKAFINITRVQVIR
jgi:hypothetical protein